MKRTSLKRKTPLKAKSHPRGKSGLKRNSGPSRGKPPAIKTLRNRCDALLTPIIKKMYPNCLLCGMETQVAHHHLKKSTSSACRYYLPNLINLCHRCHLRLHSDETLWSGRIVALKGLKWLADLEEKKKEMVRTTKGWYRENYERLSKLKD